MKAIEEKILSHIATLEEVEQWEKYVFENFSTIDLDRVKVLRAEAELIKRKKAIEEGVYQYIQTVEEILKMEQENKEIQTYLSKIEMLKTISLEELKLLKQHCKDSVFKKIQETTHLQIPRTTIKKDFYTEEDHLFIAPPRIQEMYFAFKEEMLKLDTNIEIDFTRVYVIFRGNIRSVGSALIQKKQIKIYPNFKKDHSSRFLDPKGIVTDISESGIWGRDFEIIYNHINQLEDIMDIMKQSYQING
ncbi:hypothetical protein [Helicobacter kayseriensis]|uniref:hypothetical protein n=1 Tax=Helicobacter kayseriensis TaxID=2905877 RepID=UPI001E48EA06|nr:hypothetical protein [Helicobacter kayseriensis]MCE3047490.1 hypothetical protein [Helicobacter kayseriensis]MCE3048777.1 hypothetical protein [Helicobacter kayseriensis]